MKNFLSIETINNLPVHDADLISVRVETSFSGDAGLDLTIRIDPEESFEQFIALGLTTRVVNFHFEKCKQVILNLLSYQTKMEQVFDWSVVPDSEKLRKLKESCLLSEGRLLHHSFELSGGSTIEIFAEKVFVEDVANANVQREQFE